MGRWVYKAESGFGGEVRGGRLFGVWYGAGMVTSL